MKIRASAGILAASLLIPLFQGAAAQTGPIKIGVVLPYAPPMNVYSEAVEASMRIVLEEVGYKIAGRPVQLIIENDENKPPQTVEKTRKLITSDKVDVLVGGLASHLALPFAQEAAKFQQPSLIATAGHADVTGKDCSKWVMRYTFSNVQVVRDSGKWFYNSGVKSMFFVAADFAAGHEIVDSVKAGFVAAGGKVAGEAYPPMTVRDLGPYLAQIKAANAEMVYAYMPGSLAIQFVLEYDKFGLKSQTRLGGTGWTVSPLFLPKQGKAALGFIGPINYFPSLDNPANRKFVAAHLKRTGREPDEISVNGYDTMQVIVRAIESLKGKTDDKAALAAALAKVRFDSPRGPIRLDPKTNNVIQNVYMVRVVEKAGKITYEVLDTIKDVQDPVNGCKL